MATVPEPVAAFLRNTRIAVVGVSRDPRDFSRAVFRKLAENRGHVVPVNPHVEEVDGVPCYPDLASIPEPVAAVMVVAPPSVSADIVEEAAKVGVSRVWMHRSFGEGSVSDEAVRRCAELGVECIVGGCPLMYYEPVDWGHRCMRWWLGRRGKVPM